MDDSIKQQFPALLNRPDSVFLDGPAGTQVPQMVIESISQYYATCNANTHGVFATSCETDEVMAKVRDDVATFLGAEGPHTISLGNNMTSLCYSLSLGIGRILQPGDEVLITQLDHEANRGPWLSLRERGIIVKEVSLQNDGRLNYNDLEEKLNDRTRLLAMGYASNLLGTVNDVKLARRLTYRYGTWLLLDAVHAAPHISMDVREIGCDFLLCSAYKFYGPHVGLLYSRPGLLDRLQTNRLRTNDQYAPYCIETGTLNHAAMAGVSAAIQWLASMGKGDTLRQQLVSSLDRIRSHEFGLAKKLYKKLDKIDGVEIIGPSFRDPERAPTLALVVEGYRPENVCTLLAEKGIYAWDGHFYAQRGVEVLGLLEQGGVTRIGLSAYSTQEDVARTVGAFQNLVESRKS